MKKLLAIASTLVLAMGCMLGLAACGGGSDAGEGVSNCQFELLEDGSGYALTGFTLTKTWGKAPEEITLPSSYKGLPVKVLGNGERALDGASQFYEVKKINIPASVTFVRGYALGHGGNKEHAHPNFVFESPSTVRADLRSICNRITDEYVKLPGVTVVYDEDAATVPSTAYALSLCVDCPNLKTLDLSDCKFEETEVPLNDVLDELTIYRDCPKFKQLVLPGGYEYKDIYSLAPAFLVKGTVEDTSWSWDYSFYTLDSGRVPPSLYWYSETQPTGGVDDEHLGDGYWHYVDGIPQLW